MKTHKKFLKFSVTLITAALLLTSFGNVALAAERTPFGFIDEREANADKNFVAEHRDVLETLYQGAMNHKTEINISAYAVPRGEAQPLFEALIGVYPELFFLEHAFSFRRAGNNIYSLYLEYLYTAAETATMLQAFYDKADEYLALVNDSMDDFTKALILHDALAENCFYRITTNPDPSVINSTNYTFMVEGWGRCENYAEVYAYLLAQLGIKSEIINSEEMVHEWMKIKLDGDEYYYNVDLTWDDPVYGSSPKDRPYTVPHTFFLLSDEYIRNMADPHTGYDSKYPSDNRYDDYNNLHSIDNPFCYTNNNLYTIVSTPGDQKGYLSVYNHSDDSLEYVLTIDDFWYVNGQSGAYWTRNFSGIGMYDGLLYFNGPNTIYTYNPVTGEKSTYLDNLFDDGRSLYDMYVRDGEIYGVVSDHPSHASEIINLGPCAPSVLVGDVDQDGEIDIVDATQIQYALAGIITPDERAVRTADFNNDGSVTVDDVTDLQHALCQ
ncbi:MAG: hypothetical protein IJH96_00050 [Ruminococcus sp.]|nr:hypothetical protein [Ruminococcus sp.]